MQVLGEPGVRRGAGRGGEYAFCWRGQSGSVQSDVVTVNPLKAYELTGWFKAESSAAADGKAADETGLVRVLFGLVPDKDAMQRAMADGRLEADPKRGKWLGLVAQDVPYGEWTELKVWIHPEQWWRGVDRVRAMISPKLAGSAKALLIDELALRVVEEGGSPLEIKP